MLGIILLGVAIILIVFYTIFTRNSLRGKKEKLVWIAFFLLTLILGLRNAQLELGTDLNNYYKLYERAIESKSLVQFLMSSEMEKGYLCLNWFLAKIIRWPQFIVIFQAAVCCGITMRFIYKYSKDLLFSILGFMSLGILQFFLTGFRQSLAIAICLLAYEMAEKRKLFKFLLLVAIAILVHQTAVIYVVVYVVVRVKVNRFFILSDILLICIISRYVPQLIQIGNDVFEREYSGVYFGTNLGGIITLAIGGFTILILLYRIRYGEIANQSMIHILIWGVGIYALRFEALVLERVSLFFMPSLFILLPEAIQEGFVEGNKKVLKIVGVFAMLFLMFWRMRSIEYVPFWQSVI